MATVKLTDRAVEALKPPATGNRITYDSKMPGFGVRVTAAGVKAFMVAYSVGGSERRMTIGRYKSKDGDKVWTVAAARARAREVRQLADQDKDPLAARQAERAAPRVKDLAERYCEEHLPRKRPSSQADDRVMLRDYVLPALGRMKVSEVQHTDVDALHSSLRAKPYRGNRVIALVSKMFSLALKWGWVERNPARGVERYPEEPRNRYLTPEELERLIETLAAWPNRTAANAIMLMVLTGARRGEIVSAKWGEFDLNLGIWTKPSSTTKQRKEHRIPLSAEAVDLLRGVHAEAVARRKDGRVAAIDPAKDYVFPGQVPGTPCAAIKAAWGPIREAAGLEGVRAHDLRHSFASFLASSGASLPLIGAMLGHTQAQTTLRYAHLLDAPLREAAEAVGKIVTKAGKRSARRGEVVPLGRRGKGPRSTAGT